MAYNSKAVQELMNSGADAMNNIFDVLITFPTGLDSDGSFQQKARVRLKGDWNPPEPETGTYDIEYHGVAITRPKTTMTLDRKFELTFRLDASYELYNRFISWHNYATDPNTGSFADTITEDAMGSIVVRQLAGSFMAPGSNGMIGLLDNETTAVKKDSVITPEWGFKGVWVSKVSQPKFHAGKEAAEQDYTVSFIFDDISYPFYTGYKYHGEN